MATPTVRRVMVVVELVCETEQLAVVGVIALQVPPSAAAVPVGIFPMQAAGQFVLGKFLAAEDVDALQLATQPSLLFCGEARDDLRELQVVVGHFVFFLSHARLVIVKLPKITP